MRKKKIFGRFVDNSDVDVQVKINLLELENQSIFLLGALCGHHVSNCE